MLANEISGILCKQSDSGKSFFTLFSSIISDFYESSSDEYAYPIEEFASSSGPDAH